MSRLHEYQELVRELRDRESHAPYNTTRYYLEKVKPLEELLEMARDVAQHASARGLRQDLKIGEAISKSKLSGAGPRKRVSIEEIARGWNIFQAPHSSLAGNYGNQRSVPNPQHGVLLTPEGTLLGYSVQERMGAEGVLPVYRPDLVKFSVDTCLAPGSWRGSASYAPELTGPFPDTVAYITLQLAAFAEDNLR